MTDTAPAYAQAIEQLRAENAELRRQIATGDYLLRPAPLTLAELLAEPQVEGLRKRAEAAEKDRDDLRAQLEAVTAERDAAIAAREDANENIRGWVEEYARLEKQLKAVTAKRGTDNIRHDFAAASQQNIRLRLAIENLKTMFHAAIDAAERVP